LGLILGLSLGLGIPALIIIVGGLLYKSRKRKRAGFNLYHEDNGDMPLKPRGIIPNSSEALTRHIFLNSF
jgi:hypothetical protein